MKIAFFTDTFYPQINGVVSSVVTIATELGKRGHKVLIFAPGVGKTNKFDAKNIEVISVPSFPALVYPQFRISAGGFLLALRHLPFFRPDVIHFHTQLSLGLDAFLYAKIFRKPLVGTNHIYISKNNQDFFKSISNNRLVLNILTIITLDYFKFIFGNCDIATCPSRGLINELKKAGVKKNFEYIVNPIPNTYQRELKMEQITSLKSKYKLKENVIIHFGRLSKEKNVDIVIMAFSVVLRKRKDCSLLIIGNGPAKKDLEVLAQKYDPEGKHVVFTGFIAHQELMSSGLMSVADLFATASAMENQSMAVIEAMSSGLPIIAVNEAGLTEQVSSNGFLVEKGDYVGVGERMIQLFEDKSLAKKMGKKSKKLAITYDAKKVGVTMEKIYKDLISKK